MANRPYVTFDFEWVRGTTRPLVMSFTQNDVAIPVEDLRISVYKNKGKDLAFRCALSDTEPQVTLTDIDAGQYTFVPTAAQTRSLTESKVGEAAKNRYEVEIRNGTDEEVYLLGSITASGGLNDDEEEFS